MNIREWRKQRGLTQEALARELGTDKFTISRWELNKNKPGKLGRELLRRAGYT